MAGDQDAGRPVGHRNLAELGLGIVEQLVTLAWMGNEDFQTLDGLNTHDEQLSGDEGHNIANILT